MKNIVIFRAHLLENMAHAKKFLVRGHKVLLHSHVMTTDLIHMSKLPLVQVRLGDETALRQMALLVVE